MVYEIRVVLDPEEFGLLPENRNLVEGVAIAKTVNEKTALWLAEEIKTAQGNIEDFGVLPVILVVAVEDDGSKEYLVWRDGVRYPDRPIRG